MGFALVLSSTIDVTLELILEILESQVLFLFLLLLDTFLRFLNFDLVDNVESAAVFSLQVGPAKLEDSSLLLARLEEAISDMRNDILLLDLLHVASDLHAECHTVLAHTH